MATGLDAWLQNEPVPSGTDFPGSVDGLLALIAQYLRVAGLEDFNGLNSGAAEPAPENRNMAWYRTDESGNPLGFYHWNGAGWVIMPAFNETGGTAGRPFSPIEGQMFFDNEIHVMLVYERGKWRTLAGSPGDVKEVKAPTLEEALKRNPGWEYDRDSIGLVVAGADDTVREETADADVNDHWYGNVAGEEYHNMMIEELVNHRHLVVNSGSSGTGWDPPNASNPYLSRVGASGGNWQYNMGGNSGDANVGRSSGVVNGSGVAIEGGGGEPFNVRQPTIYYWRLVKE
jgi:hypothetical protein